MPELPEVQTVVNSLRPRLEGRRIVRVDLRRDDILQPTGVDLGAMLVGRRIRDIKRRGKRIIFTLSDAKRFYIHLGMSGRLAAVHPDEPRRPHTHLVLELAPEKIELRFSDPRRFGGIWWIGDGSAEEGLGPEPLSIRPAELFARLSRTSRAIKNALLDQSVIAGLGNIYVDESLHVAGIDPLTRADRLTREHAAALSRAIKATLRRALHHRGSTLRDYRDAAGKPGRFQKLHRVYARAGKPCARCGTPVERVVLGGRSTHFCPKCQPRGGTVTSRRERGGTATAQRGGAA